MAKRKEKKTEIKNIDGKTYIDLGLYTSKEQAKANGSRFKNYRVFKKTMKSGHEYFELFVHSTAWKTPNQLKLKKGKSKFV